jgi:hypothetical protein
LYLEDTTACIRNSSVRDNEAAGGDGAPGGQGVGGGFYIEDGSVGIQNTMISGNEASTSDDDVFGPFGTTC